MTKAEITITASTEGGGLLVSLHTDGDFSSEVIDRRFYSIPQLPPDGLDPADFWAPILNQIAGFLAARDDDREDDFTAGARGGLSGKDPETGEPLYTMADALRDMHLVDVGERIVHDPVCKCGHKKNLHAGAGADGRCANRSCGCGRYAPREAGK